MKLTKFTGKVVIKVPELSIIISKQNKIDKAKYQGLKLRFLIYIIPKNFREELLGDLLEQRSKMKEGKQPNWFINLVSLVQIFFVVVAMLKIRLSDWINPEKEKNK